MCEHIPACSRTHMHPHTICRMFKATKKGDGWVLWVLITLLSKKRPFCAFKGTILIESMVRFILFINGNKIVSAIALTSLYFLNYHHKQGTRSGVTARTLMTQKIGRYLCSNIEPLLLVCKREKKAFFIMTLNTEDSKTPQEATRNCLWTLTVYP